MIIAEITLTPETGAYGYLLTLGEDCEWPPEWPYGWRCGPMGTDTAHILTDTDTGTVTITLQTHDEPPPPTRAPPPGSSSVRRPGRDTAHVQRTACSQRFSPARRSSRTAAVSSFVQAPSPVVGSRASPPKIFS